MGDSDDEFGRRRGRDKFVKERNDFQQDKRRDFVSGERRGGYMQNRGDYRQMRDNRQGQSPPMKRIRRDWDDSYDPTIRREISSDPAPQGATTTGASGGSGHVTPTLMSFKQFLTTQDDSISDEEAIQKYHDYKLEFKRQQLHAFFVAHKDEEWFRLKYHPEDSTKRKTEQHAAIHKRLEVFQEFLEKKWLDKCNLDHDNSRNLIKFMDAVVIKLEGGTDEDVTALDKLEELLDDSYDEVPERRNIDNKENEGRPNLKRERVESESGINEHSDNNRQKKVTGEEGALSDSEVSEKGSIASGKSKSSAPPSVEAGEVGATKNELGNREGSQEPQPSGEGHEEDEKEEKHNGETKNNKHKTHSTTDEMDELSGEEDEDESSIMKKEKSPSNTKVSTLLKNNDATVNPAKMMLHKTSSIFLRNLSPSITKIEVEALCKRFPGFLRVSLAEPIADRKYYRRGWVTFKRDINIKDICWNLNSIRLKDCDMLPIVNRDLTRRVRVANGVLSHKQVAQNDLRLAARLVQIYDKKFNLWQDEVNGTEKSQLQDDPFSTAGEFNLTSRNPLLKNITDFLIEEASAEEEELLGMYASKTSEDADQKVVFERSEQILKVLDKILLYLRIVHSIDYYNHGEYPCEDEMPNRCGLIHVRGPPVPPSQFGSDDNGNTLLSTSFVNDFCKNFESKLQPLLAPKDRVSAEEADKLGRKDPEKEVEAFVNANCQELAKDKWLCPLSGKKFKGPEFIRKHILNKHIEKLEEVRGEVLYFNNFLCDAKRPGPTEVKPQPYVAQPYSQAQPSAPSSFNTNTTTSTNYGNAYDRGNRDDQPPPRQDFYRPPGGGGGGGGYEGGGGGRGGYYRNQNDYGGGGGGGGGYRRDFYQRRDFGNQGGGGYGGNRGGGTTSRHYQATPSDTRRDPRVPVTYTDLDAPEDVY